MHENCTSFFPLLTSLYIFLSLSLIYIYMYIYIYVCVCLYSLWDNHPSADAYPGSKLMYVCIYEFPLSTVHIFIQHL